MKDITKLPKWAQLEIHRLRRDLESAERKIEEMLGTSEEPSDTMIETYTPSGPEDRYLPKGTTVVFTLPTELRGLRGIRVRVRKEHDGPVLDINSDFGAIQIEPRAANSIYIRLKG